MSYPKYDELPNKSRHWPHSPNSKEEGLGKLQLLTSSNTLNASKEIQTGERVSVNWSIDKLDYAPFGRIKNDFMIKRVGTGLDAFDDEYSINPQSTSQWDGFRHHAQPKDINDGEFKSSLDDEDNHLWYGGTTAKEIQDRDNDRIGIHHWAEKGIVGRGILLDYKRYCLETKNEMGYKCFEGFEITYEEVKDLIDYYNIKIEKGDILFVRTGLIEEWNEMSIDDKKSYSINGPWKHTGLQASEDMLRFLWDSQFSAVASDSIGFETYPCTNPKYSLHYHLLAGWGVPIGEIFDLEGLSKICKKQGRFSFFFTSAPFNAVGGVSSIPNGLAIF
ncbi:hypothetical protein CANARDRAFT_8798 [[Candida] arabinofermentans NRRL YB-2248]|uniref:Cyclase n=1 Tax=[Candida] arabinofermentans NRRL YB-2248 TaxID=983967 RepID=A0A1E4SX93_9ASCO|nr:hypothetical protein CANARDRAFT_8798 [[Candida] arabinofermentans NRRL YB-2248]